MITGEENQKKRLRKMYNDVREDLRLKAAPAIKAQEDEMVKELRAMSEATSSRR